VQREEGGVVEVELALSQLQDLGEEVAEVGEEEGVEVGEVEVVALVLLGHFALEERKIN
jgi:hypothetical protein